MIPMAKQNLKVFNFFKDSSKSSICWAIQQNKKIAPKKVAYFDILNIGG
jgi:hypothetical protein